MSTDDRTHTNDVPDSDAAPPIKDLTSKDLDGPTAEEVKGGSPAAVSGEGKATFYDLSFVHNIDKA